ncbi:hypothetical protein [Herbidospora mongoliensis]|uniref:hypothetical protein n=1 Tax=Herbidospora mongoliensis TaxID=688067 RepID=UPI0012F8B13E|nr:hypothetical protein [Herbidospora mongoliensis]
MLLYLCHDALPLEGAVNESAEPPARQKMHSSPLRVTPGFSLRHGVLPITVRVDPDAVQAIREVGKVLRENTDEAYWDGVTKIYVVLLVDIGQPGPEGAVAAASSLLQRRGWTASIDRRPETVWMESPKWPDNGLMVRGAESFASRSSLDPSAQEQKKAIADAMAQTGSTGIVILEAERIDW